MKKISLLSSAVLLLLGAQTAYAANFLNTCNGRPSGHPNASLALSASSAGFPAGGMWDTSLRVAVARINDNPSKFRLSIANNSDTSVAIGNGQSEIWWSANAAESSPAVVYNYYSCDTSTGIGTITESDALFYNGEPYTANMTVSNSLYGYGGGNRPFQTTAVHELGHALGLGHVNSEYNIMGTDFYFMTTNSGVARSYLGADASAGAVTIYGNATTSVQDVSLSHWKFSGANGNYSGHAKTILANASGTELTSVVDGGDKRFAVTAGQTVQLELTRENNGQNAQNVRIGYYLSTDGTINSTDQLITSENVTANLNDPTTFRKTLTVPSGLASGNYWLGAIIDDNNALAERVEDNNAMYVKVSYTGGGTGNQSPVANFSSSVSGLTATFTDSSTDPDGSIVSRSWNFGDNSSSTLANPSKTYAAAGTYTVTLTVTDNQNATNTTSRSVTVGGSNQAPVANFSSAINGLTATFTDSSSDPDGSIASRSWNFGDNTTSTATNPAKTYAAAGTYTVTLTVTDNQGATNTTSRSVTVSSGGGLPECTASRTDELGRNCSRSNLSASTGGYKYFYIFIPSGTTQLRITTSGGTGNANLYYSPSSWATTSNYTLRSIAAGNSETITVNNPPSGYLYISVHAASAFSGVKVTTEY